MFQIQKQPAGTTWQTVGTEPTRREAMKELHRLALAEPGPAWRAVDTKTGTALLYPAGYFQKQIV